MKTIEIETCEFVEDDNGGHFEHSTRYEEFTDDRVRDNDFCTLCGFNAYPECMETCPQYKLLKEQDNVPR